MNRIFWSFWQWNMPYIAFIVIWFAGIIDIQFTVIIDRINFQRLLQIDLQIIRIFIFNNFILYGCFTGDRLCYRSQELHEDRNAIHPTIPFRGQSSANVSW